MIVTLRFVLTVEREEKGSEKGTRTDTGKETEIEKETENGTETGTETEIEIERGIDTETEIGIKETVKVTYLKMPRHKKRLKKKRKYCGGKRKNLRKMQNQSLIHMLLPHFTTKTGLISSER